LTKFTIKCCWPSGQVLSQHEYGAALMADGVGIGRTLRIERLFGQVTKYSRLVTKAEDIPVVLQEAETRLPEGGRGPVHL